MALARSHQVLLLSALLTLLLYLLPQGRYLIYPLLLLSTFVHELGHGLTAVLLGGRFESLQLWANGGGIAHTRVLPGWREAAVSAGGLLGPAIGAALCFVAGRWQTSARLSSSAFGVFCLIVCVWVVRNPFGWLVVSSTAALCLLAARYASAELGRLWLAFLAVQLGLSVFSRSDYLFDEKVKAGGVMIPSDVGNIAAVLPAPYWFWGALIGLFSVVLVAIGLLLHIRSAEME